MNLHQAIVMGRFCGLETVEECIANIELHYWNMLPYSEIAAAREEFFKEVNKWETGDVILDWDLINAEVAEQQKEYENWMDNQPKEPDLLEEFDWK